MISIFKKIWANSKGRHGTLISALALSFVKSLIGITQLIAIMTAVNFMLGKGTATDCIIQVAILTAICIVGNYAVSYTQQLSILSAGMHMSADMRINLGDRLRRYPLGFFNSSSRAQTITTLTTTLSGVENASIMVMIGIVSGLFDAFAIFIFVTIYSPIIGVISGAGMVLYLLVINWQMNRTKKYAPVVQRAQDELAKSTLGFLQGIKVTKSFSFSEGDSRLAESIKESERANISLTNKSMPSFYLGSLVIATFESIIMLMTILMHFAWNMTDVVETIILIIFSFMVYGSLNQAGSMLSMIDLLNTGLDEVDKLANGEELKVSGEAQTPRDNSISFEHVSFGYEEGNDVIQDISFCVEANSFTALVGPSGSGKTTICELIPRFRDIDRGEIKIGGADIKNMSYEDICASISMVFQRVYLFEDSIFNNVRFGKPEATLEEVREACRKARCDDFIMALPDGYDTILSEGGGSLSGGEKQRISIARAILKDSPIIILDEATASVDAENENEISKAIEELTKGKTILMIAHKMRTIKNADNILVLNHGKIVEQGTHEELLAHDGLYHDFIKAREKSLHWSL